MLQLSEPAPFKLNLCLRVVGRQPDGMHQLETLFAFVDSGDTLTWTPGGPLRLTMSGPFASAAPADATNLVLKAARLLDPSGAHDGMLHLHKTVPSGAGLGGGSADAAASLRLLNRAWGLGHTLPELATLGRALGADVPVCVYGQCAWGAGVGADLSPVTPTIARPVLVVCPSVHVSTAAVFAARSGPFSLPAQTWPPADTILDKRPFSNDLCAAAYCVAPELAKVSAVLAGLIGAHPHAVGYGMSGSGGSHFAVFNSDAECVLAEQHVRELEPAWFVVRKLVMLPPVI